MNTILQDYSLEATKVINFHQAQFYPRCINLINRLKVQDKSEGYFRFDGKLFSSCHKLLKFCLINLLFTLLLDFQITPAIAEDFNTYMNQWDINRELAIQKLLEAEKALKEGDKVIGCIKQKEASALGVKATKSLIKAMEINGSTDGIENFNSGLNKWKELGDLCK